VLRDVRIGRANEAVQEAESWRAEVEELADGLLDLQGTRSSSGVVTR